MDHSNIDYLLHIEDEIALEGLDGITLQGLWLRLSVRCNFVGDLPLDENSKQFLWSLITEDNEISFYCLQNSRSHLKIINRYDYINKETGDIFEPTEDIEDIYTISPVEDDKTDIKGSCSTYHSRKDVTDEIVDWTLSAVVEKYGDRLVLVASQILRNRSLHINLVIDKSYDLGIMQYIMLERIGRSRNLGEITMGKMSLACLNIPPKTAYYYRKRLLALNLIKKQKHMQYSVKGHCASSVLLHLTRFFVVRREKSAVIIEKFIEMLQNSPNHILPYDYMKSEVGMTALLACKKLSVKPAFVNHIQLALAPYRTIYPDATEKEWKLKHGRVNQERRIRCCKLISVPSNQNDDECEDADEDEDEDGTSSGILDQSRLVHRKSMLQQSYKYIESMGSNGVSQVELGRHMGQPRLTSRFILRQLEKRCVIHSIMKDEARQKVIRYVSDKFASTGHLTQEFEAERKKMIDIVNTKHVDTKENAFNSSLKHSRILEVEEPEQIEIGLEMLHSGESTSATITKETEFNESQNTDWKNLHCSTLVVKAEGSDRDGTASTSTHGTSFDLTSKLLNSLSSSHSKASFTTKFLKRANIIIEKMRQLKIIEDTYVMMKHIHEVESSENVEMKMDIKSLIRLMNHLTSAGFLKKIVVKIKIDNELKECTFFTDTDINLESNILKQAIERQKQKFCVKLSKLSMTDGSPSKDDAGNKSKNTKLMKAEEDNSLSASVNELKKMYNLKSNMASRNKEKFVSSQMVFVNRNNVPKFIRLMGIHKLLFYLVYGYDGDEHLDQEKVWNSITESFPEDLSADSVKDYPKIYQNVCSDKMFIPPLPKHERYTTGWIFFVDLLLRLPLSVFVQIINVTSKTNVFSEYLKHPVKKNLLIKDLPLEIRKSLFSERRYITDLLDECKKLCFIGLLQLGTKLKIEKDQLFVYLNKNASLIDTTISEPAYHYISPDKDYVRNSYTFETCADVRQYWHDLWTICLHTPLGGFLSSQGQQVTIHVLNRKPEMIKAVEATEPDEAQLKDDGIIPGDGRGAAGFDSALFAHLRRNWAVSSSNSLAASVKTQSTKSDEPTTGSSFSYAQYLQDSTVTNASTKLEFNALPGSKNVRLSLYKPKWKGKDADPVAVSVGMVTTHKKNKKPRSQKKDITKPPAKEKVRSRNSFKRLIQVRPKVPKKPYYDDKDKAALLRMSKLRVDWFPVEDSLLLLCKVAAMYLFGTKQSLVVHGINRDILHSHYPESRNKTSRACQRRINYIMKNQVTRENVAIILGELKQNKEITREFKPLDSLIKIQEILKNYMGLYKKLVHRLVSVYALNKTKDAINLPNTYEEFKAKFKAVKASEILPDSQKMMPVTSIKHIDHYVVNALIFSSLCTKQDRESWAYQLYLAYQNYSQNLLSEVLCSIRDSKMVSYRKLYNRSKFAQSCLPLTSSPFQLSVSYLYTFHSKYSYKIFNGCWGLIKNLLNSELSKVLEAPNEDSKVSRYKYAEGDPQSSVDGKGVVVKSKKRRKPQWSGSDDKKMSREMRKNKRMQSAKSSESSSKSNKQENTDENLTKTCGDSNTSVSPTEIKTKNTSTDAFKESLSLLPSTIEGGPCSCILSLIATNRITLNLRVPDQIIKISNNTKEIYSEKSLMERVKYHEMASEREYEGPDSGCYDLDQMNMDEDIYTDRKEDEKSGGNNLKRKFFFIDDANIATKKLRKEDSTTVSNSESQDNIESEITEENEENIKPKSSHSKMRMFMARERVTDELCNSPSWALDNIYLVNCELRCGLKTPPEGLNSISNAVSCQEIGDVFLPISKHKITEALTARKKVVLADWNSLPHALDLLKEEGRSADFLNLVERMYEFIHSKMDLGSSAKEIKNEFAPGEPELNPMKVLREIESINLVWRVGVDTFRWVTIPYLKHWLIKTNKIPRNQTRNSESFRLSGVYEVKNVAKESVLDDADGNTASSSIGASNQDNAETEGSIKPAEATAEEETSTSKNEPESLASTSKARRTRSSDTQNIRPRLAILKSRYRKDTEAIKKAEEAVNKQQALSVHEEISVAVRPWVRLNGCLNRRVMDRLTGSILLYIMENPGISGQKIADKFWPALQPAHSYELIETLVILEAVHRFYVKKSHKASLFSKPQIIYSEIAEEHDFDESMIYEAEVDCLVKMAAFIGDKKYSQDFLMLNTK